ncbi:reverse transcriptase-like protein [bacterium]|nr:reverse transcriptase-like protein [bacterium]
MVRFDGGARGNPGPAAAGAVAFLDGEVVSSRGVFLGKKTNNEAEYEGFLLALSLYGESGEQGSIEGDSLLILNQVMGKWKVKATHLREIVIEARKEWNLLGAPPLRHIPREENKEADAQVNTVLDQECP